MELFIMLAAAAGCLIYYSIIISYAGIHSSMAGLWLFAGCALLLAAMILVLDKKYDFLKVIPKWILLVIATCILTVGLLVLILFGCVMSKMNASPDKNADYVIVLGAQIRGENITRSLKYRLDKAIEYFETNADCMIIVSGGRGEGEAVSEASAMKKYLCQHGIPEEKIIMEEKSTTTNENLRFSHEIIKSRGDENANIVICSNNFHIFRALKLAEKIGIENAMGLAAKSDSILQFNYMIRDSLAIFKEFLLGNI
ncbi:MAG: YdcF family protein [Lachnospiraceae bacterium]